jgi:hypothetical protein
MKLQDAKTQPPLAPTPSSSSAKRTWWILLVCSISLLVAGILLKYSPLVEAGSRDFASGAFFKVGLVIGLAWLAAPQLERLGWERMRGTGLAVIVVIAALTAIRPRIGAIAAGMAVGGFLVLAMLGWVRGVIFSGAGTATIDAKSRKIEKNPTRR